MRPRDPRLARRHEPLEDAPPPWGGSPSTRLTDVRAVPPRPRHAFPALWVSPNEEDGDGGVKRDARTGKVVRSPGASLQATRKGT